jgi:hypothetical protein
MSRGKCASLGLPTHLGLPRRLVGRPARNARRSLLGKKPGSGVAISEESDVFLKQDRIVELFEVAVKAMHNKGLRDNTVN